MNPPKTSPSLFSFYNFIVLVFLVVTLIALIIHFFPQGDVADFLGILQQKFTTDQWAIISAILATVALVGIPISILTGLYPVFTRRWDKKALVEKEQKELDASLIHYRNGDWIPSGQLEYNKDFIRASRTIDELGNHSNYHSREVYEAELLGNLFADKNVIVTGFPERGKTRFVIETLKKMPDTICLIVERARFPKVPIFPECPMGPFRKILVFDDMQDFFESERKRDDTLSLISAATSSVNKFQIVATCRQEQLKQVEKGYAGLDSGLFDKYELPEWKIAEIDEVLRKNGKLQVPDTCDGKNIGTVFGLKEFKRIYSSKNNEPEQKVLKAIKGLFYLGILNNQGEIEKGWIRNYISNVLKDDLSDENFHIAHQWCIENHFVNNGHAGIVPIEKLLEYVVFPEYTIKNIIDDGLLI